MLEERARVVAVHNARATVELEPSGHCGGCAMAALCGERKYRFELDAVPGLEPGQTVVVALDRSGSLRGILLLFGLPLVGLVSGVLLGQSYPIFHLSPEVSSVVLALMFVAVAAVVALIYEKKVAAKNAPQPTIVRTEDQ